MVRFVGKGHLNDQNPFFGQILVRHLAEKLAFSEFLFQYRIILSNFNPASTWYLLAAVYIAHLASPGQTFNFSSPLFNEGI